MDGWVIRLAFGSKWWMVGSSAPLHLAAELLADENCHAFLEYGRVRAIQKQKEVSERVVLRMLHLVHELRVCLPRDSLELLFLLFIRRLTPALVPDGLDLAFHLRTRMPEKCVQEVKF